MSKSMVVALVALFFSLSGWGVAAKVALSPANSVGTQQIVNGSVRLVDIHPSAATALRGQRGEIGPQGLTGLAGPAGPAGLPGAPGTSLNKSQLETDIQNLCRGVRDIQNKYPYGTFYYPANFAASLCYYKY